MTSCYILPQVVAFVAAVQQLCTGLRFNETTVQFTCNVNLKYLILWLNARV